MADLLDEKEHLLSEKSLNKKFSKDVVVNVADNEDAPNTSEETLSNTREFCKSMEHFGKVSGNEWNLLGHGLSKSSNQITEVQYDSITIYQELKRSMSNKCQRTIPSSPEIRSSKIQCNCFEDSGSADGTPTVHMEHKNGQVVLLEPNPSNESQNLAKNFRYVQSPSRYETSQSSESVICRICHSSGDETLIAPCKCAGSTRYVHATCLVTWFKKSVKHECELCKSDVKVRKINHNIALWRKPEDRPVPLIWFSVFFIGLFLNILSIYVNASEHCKSTACLIFYVVNGFGIILDAVFLWFWFLKCRHYWKKWCALNQDWFIDDCTEEPMVQFVQAV